MTPPTKDRALGALQGLALGDALGMPTQSMSPAEIERHYGRVEGLLDAVAEQPIAPSMPAGSITDDTEQAILLARLLIAGHGAIDPYEFATSLLAWEADMIARDSLDLLGPSTKAALDRVHAGEDPNVTGRTGTTNGAAMRVTPVGIAVGLEDPGRFADVVHDSCRITHDTQQGWESAALIGAAVSAGIDGADVEEALRRAFTLVEHVGGRGHWSPKASVLARSREALRGMASLPTDELVAQLRTVVGTSVESTESIPCALVLAARFADNPWRGLCVAAELGGDTDTIAAMAGAVLGACLGSAAFPAEALQTVRDVNELDLGSLSEWLLALRANGSQP